MRNEHTRQMGFDVIERTGPRNQRRSDQIVRRTLARLISRHSLLTAAVSHSASTCGFSNLHGPKLDKAITIARGEIAG
jgi:hypothetical protein